MDLGHSPDGFGLHSLRAGGASAVAQAGIPDRLFKQHGRWSSETAKDGYIEDSKENRLSVSKNIGIQYFLACNIYRCVLHFFFMQVVRVFLFSPTGPSLLLYGVDYVIITGGRICSHTPDWCFVI